MDAAPRRNLGTLARLLGRAVRIALYGAAGVLLAAGGLWFWYTHRPLPAPVEKPLFRGVEYRREVLSTPRPMVVHVAVVDLRAPGIEVLVTPGDPGEERPLPARTTSQFLREFGVQLAVNGDFFEPWWSRSPWDYYPHVGDRVEALGFAASRGEIYSDPQLGRKRRPTLYFTADNRASFDQPAGGVHNAISGYPLLVKDGAPAETFPPGYDDVLHPRTAAGLDREGRRLILVVVDGRQPNYSEGCTLAELAEMMVRHGAHTAMNLDGGGSSAMVVEDRQGRPLLLNSSIDNHIPGRERPVGSHLGIFARPLESGGA